MPIVWHKWLSKIIKSPSSSRTLSTLKGDPGQRILKSPPLLSLDLPESWTSNTLHYDSRPSTEFSTEQRCQVIDGKAMADQIRAGIASEVIRMKESIGKVPGLAVILVGQRLDSQTYVRNKRLACEEAGINFTLMHLADTCTGDQVRNALSNFNKDPSVHGVLVQLPLPQHLDEDRIFRVLSLEKDVDGFHPLNIGHLAMEGFEPLFIPCTPKGCIEMLLRSGVEIMGKNAVVIGRSNIVGLPASLLLQRHHATVSSIHALTTNPEEITRQADILITAAGVPNLVRGSWLKPGAVVIDVGTHPVELPIMDSDKLLETNYQLSRNQIVVQLKELKAYKIMQIDPDTEYGYRLLGDVCFEEAVKVASAVTPVPGGVGPMTIAMLLSNTLDSAKRAFNFT